MPNPCDWEYELPNGVKVRCLMHENHRPFKLWPHHVPDKSLIPRNDVILNGQRLVRDPHRR